MTSLSFMHSDLFFSYFANFWFESNAKTYFLLEYTDLQCGVYYVEFEWGSPNFLAVSLCVCVFALKLRTSNPRYHYYHCALVHNFHMYVFYISHVFGPGTHITKQLWISLIFIERSMLIIIKDFVMFFYET